MHLILGSTLLLLFGAGAAAIGLAVGLLIQGLFFAQFDLPQYGMNVTTLLLPLGASTCWPSASSRRALPMWDSATRRRWHCPPPTRAASSPGWRSGVLRPRLLQREPGVGRQLRPGLHERGAARTADRPGVLAAARPCRATARVRCSTCACTSLGLTCAGPPGGLASSLPALGA